MGNSTNKKDAQTNAARDFVNYLVRIGEMTAAEVPALGVRKAFLFVLMVRSLLSLLNESLVPSGERS